MLCQLSYAGIPSSVHFAVLRRHGRGPQYAADGWLRGDCGCATHIPSAQSFHLRWYRPFIQVSVSRGMSLRPVATTVGLLLLVGSAGPAVGNDDSTAITLTTPALQTIDESEVAVAPIGPALELAPAVFSFPVSKVSRSRSGEVRVIRLSGGLRLSGTATPLDLTKLRLNLAARRASVRDASSGLRVAAFDVGRLRVSDRRVRGVLLIAPGASAVFNEQFDTYVFSDGLRFARFTYPLK
jgi:hypothetical protein